MTHSIPPRKKRNRGNPNQTTGLRVYKNGNKYQASITYGGKQTHIGRFDTKEQAGIAYDRFIIDKSTEEVSFTFNYSGNNKDGTDDTDPPTTPIKQDPEAELILHKAKEVHVKSEPEAEVHISPVQATTMNGVVNIQPELALYMIDFSTLPDGTPLTEAWIVRQFAKLKVANKRRYNYPKR